MAKTPRGSGPFAAAEATLRAHAMAKPEATEHFPWGERAIKVKGKVFLFMYADATKLSLSTKLPASSGVALMLPFAQPTGYGLGKAGWVSASFDAGSDLPVDMLCDWIDESYQAVAPAKLAALARSAAPSSDDPGGNAASTAIPTKRSATSARRPASPAKRPAARAARKTARPAARSPKRAARPARRRG